ncbi:MAG: SGNH/GDSL hydrolase family protein [Anaerolineae bacterium]|nr:SGNH/GDSL hydrolase family protein [Anaerolineae bacterium]
MSSEKIRYLALGDSYTIGEGVRAEERWPAQLAAALSQRGIVVDELTIVAQTGWTTDELMAGIEQAAPQGPYDLVTLLIGVNNQYRGWDREVYREEFRALLAQAIDFAGGRRDRVVVLSIPDWSVKAFATGRDRQQIAWEIDQFNAINRVETGRAGARYVDVAPVSRGAQDDPGMTAEDGLHPSGAMYRLWADLALPVVGAALLERVR